MSHPELSANNNQWDGELRIPNPEEQLPDEVIANLLASITTNEAKALTLIAMAKTGDWYTNYELYEEIMTIQGNARGKGVAWKMSKKTPFSYCEKSLEPIGLVVRGLKYDPYSGAEMDAYQISEFGDRIGVPIAGLMLDYSFRHPDYSLVKLFGSPQSNSKSSVIGTSFGEVEYKHRSPERRLKILRILAKADMPISVIDVSKATGIHQSVIASHLVNLADYGFINYKSVESGREFVEYRLNLSSHVNQLPYKKTDTLFSAIYDVVYDLTREGVTISSETVFERLYVVKSILPADEKSLRNYISFTLWQLGKQSYLDKISEFNGETRSLASLSGSNSETIGELILQIDAFSQQDSQTLAKGKQLAFEIIHNTSIVNQLMEKSRKTSSHSEIVSFREWQTRILAILVNEPNGITTEELRTKLHNEIKQIAKTSIRKLLRTLSNKGYIRFTTVKGIRIWCVVPQVTDQIIFQYSGEKEGIIDGTNTDTTDEKPNNITKDMILKDPLLLLRLFNEGRVIIRQKGGKRGRYSTVLTCLEIGAKGWETTIEQETGTQNFMVSGRKMEGKRYYFEPGTVKLPE